MKVSEVLPPIERRFEDNPTISEDKIVISHPPLRRPDSSHPGDAFCMKRYHISRSCYLPKCHEMLRLPLLLYRAITLLSYDFSELLLYWTVAFTELLLYGTVTLLKCYFTGLWLYWTVTLMKGYFTELLLYWTVTLLNCYFTELLLYWTVTLLKCYFTELLLYGAVTLLNCDFTLLKCYFTEFRAFLKLHNSEVSHPNFLWWYLCLYSWKSTCMFPWCADDALCNHCEVLPGSLRCFFWSCNFGYRPNHSAKDVLTWIRIMFFFLFRLNCQF